MSRDLVRDPHIGVEVAPVVVEDVVQDGLSRVREGSVGISHRCMLGAIPAIYLQPLVRGSDPSASPRTHGPTPAGRPWDATTMTDAVVGFREGVSSAWA